MSKLVEVFRSPHTPTAQLVRSALVAHGLNAHVVGEHLAGMIGAAARLLPARVLVPEEQVDEALAAIELMHAMGDEDADPDDPSSCPSCGAEWEPGFDVCWQCQAELERG